MPVVIPDIPNEVVAGAASGGTIGAQGTPDSGVTFKTLKTASDGTLADNATLQAGTALAGGIMSYREMVARALVGSVKYLTGSVALANAQTGAITFVDQNNTSYSTVTTGKTLYIAYIDATCNTTSTDVLQTSLLTLTDGTNLKYQYLVSQQTPPRELAIPITLASATTLTVKAGTSSAGANFAGSMYVSLLVWEE